EWLTWPGYNKFWAQVVRHALRRNESRGVAVQIEPKGRQVTVTLDAVNAVGRYLNNVETELTVIDPQHGKRKLALTQTAPGRYALTFATPQAGAYHLELVQRQQGKLLFHQSRGLVVGYPDELRLRPPNEELLRTLARVTGGRYAPEPEAVFEPFDRSA